MHAQTRPEPPTHGQARGVVIMHSFASVVHNEDTTWNIDQITHSLYEMSIFLDLLLRSASWVAWK